MYSNGKKKIIRAKSMGLNDPNAAMISAADTHSLMNTKSKKVDTGSDNALDDDDTIDRLP
jgi:hypothetical protein